MISATNLFTILIVYTTVEPAAHDQDIINHLIVLKIILQSNLSAITRCPLYRGFQYLAKKRKNHGDARVVLWLEKAFKKITENIYRC